MLSAPRSSSSLRSLLASAGQPRSATRQPLSSFCTVTCVPSPLRSATWLTALMLCSRSGSTRSPARVARSRCRREASHMASPITTSPASNSIATRRGVMSSPSARGGVRTRAATPRGQKQRQHRKQRRHHDDVDDLERRAQPLDVRVQSGAHCAQLLADAQLLGLEVLDLLLLLGGDDEGGVFAALGAQRAQLVFGFAQLLLELLLLGAEAVIGRAPQLVYPLKRPGEGSAAAYADQV